MSILAREYFHNEKAAFAKLESIVWPKGPVCPHCGNDKKKIYEIKTRLGVKKCGSCRKQFTVRVGTVFESSHIPVHKWLQACYLMCSSKKGISSHQLHRILEVTYKTAWFMTHRIRKAMERGTMIPEMGGSGGIVEMDETYIGKGVYQHCSEKHLHRYLAEFDFRYSNRLALSVNDEKRTDRVLSGIKGKRLTYRGTDSSASNQER